MQKAPLTSANTAREPLAMPVTIRKIARAAAAAMPKWLLLTFAACAVIPGPFDELAAVAVLVILCAAQPIRARRACSAWRGGKSHRSSDR